MDQRHTLNYQLLRKYRRNWPWTRFAGSAACLKWSFRDLQQLDKAMKLTRGRACAVQAGGNLGLFPKRLAEEFARVITFEPDERLYAATKRNAPESNIEVIRACLGYDRTPVSLSGKRRDSSGRPAHEGLTHVAGAGAIPQVRLDDYDLPACDLLYLDIEGYEMFALRGAEKTIDRFRPVIGVEINRNTSFYGIDAGELRKWITSKNYMLSLRMNSDEVYTPC